MMLRRKLVTVLGTAVAVVSVLVLYAYVSGEPEHEANLAIRLSSQVLELATPECVQAGDVVVTAPAGNTIADEDLAIWKASFDSARATFATSDTPARTSKAWSATRLQDHRRLVASVSGTVIGSSARKTYTVAVDIEPLQSSEAWVRGKRASAERFQHYAGSC